MEPTLCTVSFSKFSHRRKARELAVKSQQYDEDILSK